MDRRTFVSATVLAAAAHRSWHLPLLRNPPPRPKNVVLVHGLFCRRIKLIKVDFRDCRRRGLNVTAVQNPSPTTLPEAVDATLRVLALQPDDRQFSPGIRFPG